MLKITYRGSLWHHGILGQRWGVRRSPKELGHEVAKSQKDGTIKESYHSDKGFSVAVTKLAGYCLNPERKHSKEFFDVGYTKDDSDLLFKHIEEGFDMKKKTGERTTDKNEKQFRIPMMLGVTVKKPFSTSWQIDPGSTEPRMTSAYRDRRSKREGD